MLAFRISVSLDGPLIRRLRANKRYFPFFAAVRKPLYRVSGTEASNPSPSAGSAYRFHGRWLETAMPYGPFPVATVAVTFKVVGSTTDSVFAPWSAT